jgi:hypothetical protein
MDPPVHVMTYCMRVSRAARTAMAAAACSLACSVLMWVWRPDGMHHACKSAKTAPRPPALSLFFSCRRRRRRLSALTHPGHHSPARLFLANTACMRAASESTRSIDPSRSSRILPLLLFM